MLSQRNKIVLPRRRVLGILPAALLARSPRADSAAEQAARQEGTLTWYIAQVDAETAEALRNRFTAAYPGVAVQAIRTTGQVAYQRLLPEIKNSAPECD